MSGRQNDKWYELTPEQVANRFGSDPVQGLDSAEAEKRSRILAERLREEQKGKKKEDKLRTVGGSPLDGFNALFEVFGDAPRV